MRATASISSDASIAVISSGTAAIVRPLRRGEAAEQSALTLAERAVAPGGEAQHLPRQDLTTSEGTAQVRVLPAEPGPGDTPEPGAAPGEG